MEDLTWITHKPFWEGRIDKENNDFLRARSSLEMAADKARAGARITLNFKMKYPVTKIYTNVFFFKINITKSAALMALCKSCIITTNIHGYVKL